MVHVVSEQLGNYRLTHVLGAGASARVYLAEHLHLRTRVAIKVLDAFLTNEDLERFYREARRISRLIHPHIVRVLEWDIQDRVPFIVMEYAPHGTLRQRHPKGTQIALTTIASYVQQIASAIAYAHDQGLIHRDIKPENILIGRQNELLLSDFGIAVVTQNEQPQTFQEAAGTIAYMAPEQLQQHPQMASDQYALGCMVYEWLCGTPPFQGSLVEVIQHHRVTPPPPLWMKVPTLSPLVESVVVKALAKNPNDRFKNIQSFATAFASACTASHYPPAPVRLVPETK
jgi:serine/threonine protein kinase